MNQQAPLTPANRDLYERVYLIRRVEERLIAEYGSRRIRMPLHLSIGQEGVAVGVLAAALPPDTVIGTHRSHAIYLAKGGDLQAMIDEFYSLPSGCSRGVGGSMHLADPEVGMLGATAVLGGGVPIAVGGAFAHRQLGTSNIAFAFTGDGGIDEGSFWESLNLAALLRLPVLFVVENNGYSTLTPQRTRQANLDLVTKAQAFGVTAQTTDGHDVCSLAALAAGLVSALRAGGGPALLEVMTFRKVAHVGVVPDWGSGRAVEELEREWPASDPLDFFRAVGHLSTATCRDIERAVNERIDQVFAASIAAFEALNARERLEAPPPPNPARV